MKIVPSNSGCCGVKYIRDFPNPYVKVPAFSLAIDDDNPEANTSAPEPYDNLFRGEAPRESAVDRFDRYLAYLKETRPSGIIQVYLASSYGTSEAFEEYGEDCATCECYVACEAHWTWHDILIARGFTSERAMNSNSGNYIWCWTLTYGDE